MPEPKLEQILDKTHALYQLANLLNWEHLIREIGPFYSDGPGRPEISIQVIAGLHDLKYFGRRKAGDHINAVLSACAFNLKKMLNLIAITTTAWGGAV